MVEGKGGETSEIFIGGNRGWEFWRSLKGFLPAQGRRR